LSQAASRTIHFPEKSHGLEYLYCRDRVRIIPKGVGILPTEDSYFHTGLRTARDAKRIAKEIGYAEKQGKPETAKHETEVKGNDAGARPVIRDVGVRRRIMQRSGRPRTP